MNSTLDRKLRFSDVVYAIETTPKSLRLWLQRDLVQIDTPQKDGGGWAEYTFQDIAILALVRQLVHFGIDVSNASGIANKTMSDTFFNSARMARHPGKIPASAVGLLWTNRRLWIHRTTDGDWQLTIKNCWEDQPEPDAVYLTIDVHAVMQRAFERAEESANDGEDN